ncbi:MAG: UvrD-helicase domain-containing protein [Pirellulaceae bacterium]
MSKSFLGNTQSAKRPSPGGILAMSGLNTPQRTAVLHHQGPLLVLAGAGTGKTRVITYRIAQLIKRGISPDRILGVTFTNKAANEMQERLAKLLGRKSKKKPLISTFHSLCVRILRRHIQNLGYPQKFVIYSGGDQEALARSVMREIRVSDSVIAPNQLVWAISNFKNKGLSPDDAQLAADTDKTMVAAIAYRRYQAELKRLGAVDFDDLLLLTVRLLTQHPEIRNEEANRFDHILIDEYQDTNQTQYEIVRALAGKHRNLCVVGDDDQSIYGWRGAQVEHILNFKHDWTGAQTVRLVDTYRSTQSILDIANRLIEHNTVRHGKILKAAKPGGPIPSFRQYADETKEAEAVALSISQKIRNQHRQPRDFAILFRTNEQTRSFETELRRAKLPYVLIGGQSFFDKKEVQDVTCYLRILNGSPDDTSVLRILNRPARGVGKKAAEQIVQNSVKNNKPIWDLIENAESELGDIAAAAQNGLILLRNNVRNLQQKLTERPLVDSVLELLEKVNYKREIDRLYTEPEEKESRWNAVQQVVNALGAYETENPDGSLHGFLDQLMLGDREVDDEKEKQLRKNAIFLMTMHAAKGLEFPEVYLVGLEEGILPHHRSVGENDEGIAEERRLCYVGVTRAQEILTMSMSLSRMKWGKARQRHPSRFIYEMLGKTDHPNYEKACSSEFE